MRGRSDGDHDDEDDPDEGRGEFRRTERRLIRQWLRLAYNVDGMSWERYLALSVRRRWVMHDELFEMLADREENAPNVEDDGDPPVGASIRQKRFRR